MKKQETDEPAPILIWTRFSLVNKNIRPGGWQIGRGVGTDEYIRAVVEDERRLRPRAEIFFRHTLPNIDAGARGRRTIRHVAAASDRLPGWLLGRLDEAEARYPWFQVYKVGYEDDWDWSSSLQATLLSIARECGRDTFLVASCRLDDDDVLAPAFIEAIDQYVKPAYRGFCVSFSTGFCGLWDDDAAKYKSFFTWKCPMNAMGLSYIGEYDAARMQWSTPHWSVPGAHEQVDERVPTILDGRKRLFIRSLHGSNDVDLEDDGSSKPSLSRLWRLLRGTPNENLRRILKKSEPADVREVGDIFVTI